MIIGYARVSSVGQSLDVQLDKLQTAGCERVFQEKRSGVDRERPELAKAIEFARQGDVLVISRIDRLARSLHDMLDILRELERKGATFRVLDQSIDTGTPAGRAMLQMLGVFAEFETAIRKERQLDGIAKAKAEGRSGGRPKTVTAEVEQQVRQMRADKVSLRGIAAAVGYSTATVQAILRE